MAINGSITSVMDGLKCPVTLSWERIDVKNNASTIKWELSIENKHTSIDLTFSHNEYYNVVIDGVTFKGRVNANVAVGQTKVLVSDTLTIQHNQDGTKTFDYSFYITLGTSNYAPGSHQDASGTATLDAIATKATLLTAPNFTDEENPTITYDNPAGNTLTELQACIANSKGNYIYVPYRDIDKNGSSYTFNLTIDERNALREAATSSMLALRFYIKSTYGGSTSYSFLDRTMSLEDITPDITPVARDVDTTIVALTGNDKKIVLGYSDIYYNIGVTAPAGTSIINQSIKCGAQSSSTNNGTFYNVDSNVIEFSATDSRGNVGAASVELDVVPYINVTCNQSVRLNLDGTIALVVKGNYFSGSFGAQGNTLKIEARSRESGGNWSAWGDISVLLREASNGTYLLTATMSGFDPSGTYEFQARATDRLTSAESTIDSVTLKPIFDWGKYDFNFNVPLTIEGDALADYVIETGTEAMGTNGTWYWSKWRSGKAECYGCRNYGNMAITTDWGGWFRSGSFSQDLPYGLFAATPEVIDINLRQGSSGGWVVRYEYETPTADTTGSFIVVRPKSATISQAYISFNVVGRWK